MARSGDVRPPQQERSRETLDRIVEAAELLIDGRPFDSVSIDDIINEADVSRSSFYARFPSKEALLPVLFERFTEQARVAFLAAVAVEVSEIDPSVLIEQLVRAHLGFLRRFQTANTTFEGPTLGTRHDRLQDDVVNGVVAMYLQAVDRGDDTLLAMRVEFAARAAGAVLLCAVGPPQFFSRGMKLDDDALVGEIVAMMAAYLRDAAGEPPPIRK